MNNEELVRRVKASMQKQCGERGYTAPVDVLIDIGLLTKANYERWRRGQVDYLERLCSGTLNKLTLVLRFSKSGRPEIERWYATHFVDTEWRKQSKQ